MKKSLLTMLGIAIAGMGLVSCSTEEKITSPPVTSPQSITTKTKDYLKNHSTDISISKQKIEDPKSIKYANLYGNTFVFRIDENDKLHATYFEETMNMSTEQDSLIWLKDFIATKHPEYNSFWITNLNGLSEIDTNKIIGDLEQKVDDIIGTWPLKIGEKDYLFLNGKDFFNKDSDTLQLFAVEYDIDKPEQGYFRKIDNKTGEVYIGNKKTGVLYFILTKDKEGNNKVIEIKATPKKDNSIVPDTNSNSPSNSNPTPTSNSKSNSNSNDYTIQSGDTLSELAVRFGTTVQKLRLLNHLCNEHDIIAGNKLRIK